MALNNADNNKENIKNASVIFFKYGDFIYSVIHSKVGNAEITEDLYQDFFLSIVHKPVPTDVKNIKSYLYRAIINDIADSRRRSDRYTKNFEKFEKKMKTSINKSTPEDAYISEEQLIKMLDLIKEQLPISCSEAIILRYKENMSLGEVAKEMNVKTASVSRYISIGLKILRRLLARK
ncbi:MAG: sigma-70 family RNA polymerase sigma factor [Sedimentisphaerales bacterium]|nr:sigma-70 family RNA polymerase sigma factor [Sedimentisphaerales bacterium]